MPSSAQVAAGRSPNQPQRVGARRGTGAEGARERGLRHGGQRKTSKTRQKANSQHEAVIVLWPRQRRSALGIGGEHMAAEPGGQTLHGDPAPLPSLRVTGSSVSSRWDNIPPSAAERPRGAGGAQAAAEDPRLVPEQAGSVSISPSRTQTPPHRAGDGSGAKSLCQSVTLLLYSVALVLF